MKVTFEPSQRLVLLVASREKLEEMTVNAEIGPTLNTAIGSRWSGLLPNLALHYYKKSEIKSLKRLTDTELHEQFNRCVDLGFPTAWCNPVEAKSNFEFGVGHIPSDGGIYLQHPINPQQYILPNDFSRLICSEKEAAFLRLAAALGAKSIQLTSIQTNDTKGIFNSKFKASEVAADLGFCAQFDESGSVIKQVVKKFNRPSFVKPSVPQDLSGWVQFDPDLRTMVTDRLEANVATSKVKLEFCQSLGLGGELSAKIADRGLSLGGEFSSVARSVWSFDIDYFDLDERGVESPSGSEVR